MSEDDQAYFSRRAEEEIGRAQASNHEAAVSAHYRLAGLLSRPRIWSWSGARRAARLEPLIRRTLSAYRPPYHCRDAAALFFVPVLPRHREREQECCFGLWMNKGAWPCVLPASGKQREIWP